MNAGGPGFSADPDAMARHAERFDGLGERAARIHDELSDALRDAGDCWGADEVGKSFAAGHVERADATVADLGGLPERLGDMRTRLTGTAAGYRETDRDAAGSLRGGDPDPDAG